MRALKAGQIITKECVRSVRPGYGIKPKYLEDVIGRRVRIDISENTPIKWADLLPIND